MNDFKKATIKDVYQIVNRKCCCGQGTPESGCCYEEITLPEAQALILAEDVVPGKLYKITGVHKNKTHTEERPIYVEVLFDDGTNSGTSIYLQGLSNTEFSSEGFGEFYNPKYDQINYNTGDSTTLFAQITDGGTGYSSGLGVTTTGGTGSGMLVDIIANAGVVTEIKINTLGTGYLTGDTITINSGGIDAVFTLTIGAFIGLYNIWDGDNPVYSQRPSGYIPGTKKIFGNYVWENITSKIGNAVSYTELNSADWDKIPYNTIDYNLVIDYIEYDIANDWILRRKQSEPVIDVLFPFQFWNSVNNGGHGLPAVALHGIAVAQWGNKYTSPIDLGTGLVQVNDGYFEFANFKGQYILGFQVDKYSVIKNNYRGHNTIFDGIKIDNYSYQANSKFANGAKQLYMNLSNKCWQDDIQMGLKTSVTVDTQEYLDFNTIGYQQSVYLEYGSIQRYFTFENYSGQTAVLLSSTPVEEEDPTPSLQEYITLTNRAEVSTISLLNGAEQSNIHMENNGGQLQLTLDKSSQKHLMIDTTIIDYENVIIANYPAIEEYTRISYNKLVYTFSRIFNGSVGGGQQGAITIQDMYVPTGFFISEVKILSSGLTFNAGAYLSLGIETDGSASGLDVTSGDCATLAATPIFVVTALPFTQATTLRKLIMDANVDDITAGTVNLIVTLTKL